MTPSIRHTSISQILIAAALLAGSTCCWAGDAVAQQPRSGLGQAIAGQGNAALQSLHQDLRRNLKQGLQAVLPPMEMPSDQPIAAGEHCVPKDAAIDAGHSGCRADAS